MHSKLFYLNTVHHVHKLQQASITVTSVVISHSVTATRARFCARCCRHARCVSICVFLFVCTATDLSEDKASGVEFCTALHRRPRQEMSILVNFAPQKVQNRRARHHLLDVHDYPFGSGTHDRAACGRRIGMCGYTSIPKTRRTRFFFF